MQKHQGLSPEFLTVSHIPTIVIRPMRAITCFPANFDANTTTLTSINLLEFCVPMRALIRVFHDPLLLNMHFSKQNTAHAFLSRTLYSA
jgi:hypothetical protein